MEVMGKRQNRIYVVTTNRWKQNSTIMYFYQTLSQALNKLQTCSRMPKNDNHKGCS